MSIFCAVAEHAKGIGLLHHVAHPVLRIHGRHLPDRRARGEHLNERKAKSFHLVLNGAADCAVCLRNLLVVSKPNAFDIDGPCNVASSSLTCIG